MTTTLAADQPATTTRAVSTLRPHPHNPRGVVDPVTVEDLAASIRAQGILQPLLVTPQGTVVAGHRRLAAAKLVGLETVPVIVRDLDRTAQVEIMLVENLQREDLSPIQEAEAYQRLRDAGLSSAEIARRVGVHVVRVSGRLQLLKLDQQVRWMFHRGDLPLTLGPILAKVADPERQRRFATMAAARRLTVAQLEQIVDRGAGAIAKPPPRTAPADADADGAPRGLSPSRVRALDQLATLQATPITLGDVGQLFRDTCCACGMEDLPTYCSGCPMLEMVDAILAFVGGRARAAA